MRRATSPSSMFWTFALALAACEGPTPTYVSNADIDMALAQGRYKPVCVGLKMKDEETRRYAALKIKEIHEPAVVECVCEYGYDPEEHEVDLDIMSGLAGSERDDLAECFYTALGDPEVKDRAAVLAGIVKIRPPSMAEKMRALAMDSKADPALRGQALESMGGTADAASISLLVKMLAEEPAAEVRAGAASALVGQKDPAVVAALTQAASNDKEGVVRAAALSTLRQVGGAEVDALVCKAMIEDPDPAVRNAAVLVYKGTKSDDAVECLRKKSITEEPDSGVRETLLTVLKTSPNPKVGGVICDAIPFFMKTYIKEQGPIKTPGTDIALAQNFRDPENSYACFQKALRNTSGWSCKGKQYVSHWFHEVGADNSVPKCPGPDPDSEIRLE